MVMKMSILSQRSAENSKQKSGGKIRPGIKVLTKKAMENSKATAIYDKGVAIQKKFSEIEKEIVDATGLSNPMYPRNVPYFTVAASDFGMPEVARIIVDKYGEVRGNDPVKRLYRFPVVFHSDDLGVVYPNEFKRYGGEPGYQSHYGDDGERYCQYLPPVTKEMVEQQRANRIKRAPRRQMTIRGLCEPHICPEYLQGQCKFRGSLNFYIPGVPSSSPLVMETTSEYAAEAIYTDLERIVSLYGGIPRSNPKNPGVPLFWITKVQETRSYFEEGVKKMGLQWVPKLQADIDIGGLLQNQETLQVGHTAPAAWLAAPKGMPDALMLPPSQQLAAPVNNINNVQETPEVQPQAVTQEVPQVAAQPAAPAAEAPERTEEELLDDLEGLLAVAGVENNAGADYFDLKLGVEWKESRETILKAIGIMNDFTTRGAVGIAALMGIAVKANELELSSNDFGNYALGMFGKGYTKDAKKLDALLKHFVELSEGGKEMAQAHIKASLQNATAPA